MFESSMDRANLQGNPTTGFRGWLRNLENPKYLQHLLLVPVLIFFIVWNVIPLLWLVGLSFYKYVLVTGEPLQFMGLANFHEIFNSFEIWHSLSNTFLFVIIGAGTQTFLGIVLGFIFWGSKDLPFRRVVLTLIFTPMILAPLAAGQMSIHHVRILHGSSPNETDDRRIGMVLRYCAAHVKQTKGPDTAILVAGEDRYGHFDLLPQPLEDFGAAETARHRDAVQKMGKIILDG